MLLMGSFPDIALLCRAFTQLTGLPKDGMGASRPPDGNRARGRDANATSDYRKFALLAEKGRFGQRVQEVRIVALARMQKTRDNMHFQMRGAAYWR